MKGALWIVAGHNGAGKTTIARDMLSHGLVRANYLNPDDITIEILKGDTSLPLADANLTAAKITGQQVAELIERGEPCLVETVLSTPKYAETVVRAKALGRWFGFVYIALSSEDLAVARVKLRAASGGHDVAEEKIRSRREKSFFHMSWFIHQADYAIVLCNDLPQGRPSLVLLKENGTYIHHSNIVAELDSNLGMLAKGHTPPIPR